MAVGIQKQQLLTFHLENADFSEDSHVMTHVLLLVGFRDQDRSKPSLLIYNVHQEILNRYQTI